jgi:hypothetical protein
MFVLPKKSDRETCRPFADRNVKRGARSPTDKLLPASWHPTTGIPSRATSRLATPAMVQLFLGGWLLLARSATFTPRQKESLLLLLPSRQTHPGHIIISPRKRQIAERKRGPAWTLSLDGLSASAARYLPDGDVIPKWAIRARSALPIDRALRTQLVSLRPGDNR